MTTHILSMDFSPCVYNEKRDRKSTRLNSSHITISYAVFCLKKKKKQHRNMRRAESENRVQLLLRGRVGREKDGGGHFYPSTSPGGSTGRQRSAPLPVDHAPA